MNSCRGGSHGSGSGTLVHTFTGGPLSTNVYVIEDGLSGEAIAIDPGGAVDEITTLLSERRLRLAVIVNTHGHFDHVGGNRALREATGAPLLMHRADALLAARAGALASFVRHTSEDSPAPDRYLADGEEVRAGGIILRVLHTPGHTPGGITLVDGGAAFCGDLLLAGAPGLTGLPGCSPELLFASIINRIFTLPGKTILYPGHGPSTTVAAERDKPCYAPGCRAGINSRADEIPLFPPLTKGD